MARAEPGPGHELFERTRWAHWANLAVGLWVASSPFTFGYDGTLIGWSDVATGLAVAVFAYLSLAPTRGWARYANTMLGLWLLMAPLVFHAGAPASAFATGTLAGVLVIAFAIVVPGLPGITRPTSRTAAGAYHPPGWSYNPSTWSQRLPPVLLALAGFLVARYLTAYQLGYIDGAWDPFFGAQTERVLDSRVSEAFPLPDAGLGAIGYLLDALAGLAGGERRWREAPWIVLLFGVFIVPFGVVSITLVMMQPVAVGAWCTLCLATALISLLMIPFAVDEVVASLEFVARARKAGRGVWRTILAGGAIEPERPPASGTGGGLSFPISLLATAAIGLAVMAAPAVLGTDRPLATSHYVVGPAIVTFAVIALAEPVRAARFVNAPLGLWLAASPWVLGGATAFDRWGMLVLGVGVLLLTLPRGPVRGRYGASQKVIV